MINLQLTVCFQRLIKEIIWLFMIQGHGLAMGYNYNGKLRCAEVLLQPDGSTRLIRRAETPEDYFATMIWDD